MNCCVFFFSLVQEIRSANGKIAIYCMALNILYDTNYSTAHSRFRYTDVAPNDDHIQSFERMNMPWAPAQKWKTVNHLFIYIFFSTCAHANTIEFPVCFAHNFCFKFHYKRLATTDTAQASKEEITKTDRSGVNCCRVRQRCFFPIFPN